MLTSFGVFTQTPNGECANGALYVRITPAIREFIQGTLDWVDPCAGLSRAGTCDGNVATRCTSALEGPRRTVRFDCDLLGQTCLASGVSEVSCVDYAE